MLGWLGRFLRAAVIMLVWALPAVVLAAPPPEFKRAKNLFEYGDYAAAIPLLEEMVLPGRLEDESDVAAAHRMLGVSYYQVGRKQEAAREFKSLLYVNPDAALDPFLTPPEVVEFYDNVKASMAERLPQLRELRAKEKAEREAAKNQPPPTTTEPKGPRRMLVRNVRVVPWLLFGVPLGVPQFMMGHWVRGALVFTLQAFSWVPAAAMIASARLITTGCFSEYVVLVTGGNLEHWRRDVKCAPPFGQEPGTGPAIPASDVRARFLVNTLTVMGITALLLIPAAYSVGVIDAFILPTTEVVESEVVREIPADPSRPARRPSLSVTPADEKPPRLQPQTAPP